MIATALVFSQLANAQRLEQIDTTNIFMVLFSEKDSQGIVNIYQDYQIEELVLQHVEKNKKTKGIPGYRINIFSESGQNARQRWVAVEDTFMKYYPEVPSYRDYQEPNFKIYVGDFRTKVEALQFHKRIRYKYPKSFIVNTRINYPPID